MTHLYFGLPTHTQFLILEWVWNGWQRNLPTMNLSADDHSYITFKHLCFPSRGTEQAPCSCNFSMFKGACSQILFKFLGRTQWKIKDSNQPNTGDSQKFKFIHTEYWIQEGCLNNLEFSKSIKMFSVLPLLYQAIRPFILFPCYQVLSRLLVFTSLFAVLQWRQNVQAPNRLSNLQKQTPR